LGIGNNQSYILVNCWLNPRIENLSKDVDKDVAVVVRRVLGPDSRLTWSDIIFGAGAHVLMMN
jgi:hypothetical protein